MPTAKTVFYYSRTLFGALKDVGEAVLQDHIRISNIFDVHLRRKGTFQWEIAVSYEAQS